MWQLDAKKGLSCTLGDIEQVQQVLKTVIPPENVADDSDAQAMRTRVEQLGLYAVCVFVCVFVCVCFFVCVLCVCVCVCRCLLCRH